VHAAAQAHAETMTLAGAISRRLGISLLTLWLVSVAFFTLVEVAPGDFAVATSGMDTNDADREATRKALGLDRDVVIRYRDWAISMVTGDLGTSWWARRPIVDFVAEPVGHSLWLAGVAALFALPLGLAVGIATTAVRGSVVDKSVASAAVAPMSIPDFLIAYGLMAWLGVHLGWLPVHSFLRTSCLSASAFTRARCRFCRWRPAWQPPPTEPLARRCGRNWVHPTWKWQD
tara:strand:+ start:6024 stop:6716 length:693 start_codon:yes stop_codon:yes gene_type:complete